MILVIPYRVQNLALDEVVPITGMLRRTLVSSCGGGLIRLLATRTGTVAVRTVSANPDYQITHRAPVPGKVDEAEHDGITGTLCALVQPDTAEPT